MRDLLRQRRARDERRRFVLEGPRLLDAAVDRGVELLEVYAGADVEGAARAAVERAGAEGASVFELAPGTAARVGDTVTPQAVFGVAPLRRLGPRDLARVLRETRTPVLAVVAEIADPGNAGTLVRSAEAAGAGLFVLSAGSVDAYNPKVVRASAGALFGLAVVEGVDTVTVLDALGKAGITRLGAIAAGGAAPETVDFAGPVALVLGHETRGLSGGLPIDAAVTIPLAGAAESLNVAMAGSVLLFEAARSRRATGAGS